jgi:A/G-specific adenine glycosylase
MELGAVVCTPRRPACAACPLNDYCVARLLGVQEQRPVFAQKPAVPQYCAAAAVITRSSDEQRYLLIRRPYDGLLGGLWGFPTVMLDERAPIREQVEGSLREQIGVQVDSSHSIGTVNHAYTHFRISLEIMPCTLISGEPAPGHYIEVAWADERGIQERAFAAADRKILARLNRLDKEERT